MLHVGQLTMAASWGAVMACALAGCAALASLDLVAATAQESAASSTLRHPMEFSQNSSAGGGQSSTSAAVVCPDGTAATCRVVEGAPPEGALAWGTYVNAVNATGWATLSIRAPVSPPRTQGDDIAGAGAPSVLPYAAGLLEGNLTAPLIIDFVHNMVGSNFGGNSTLRSDAEGFLMENLAYVDGQVAQNAAADPYWAQVGWSYSQVRGLAAGAGIRLEDALMINGQGDIGDIIAKLQPSVRRDWRSNMTVEDAVAFDLQHSHCSCIVKLLADQSELYSSHNMWWSYYAMTKMAKTYTFPAVSRRANGSSTTTVLYSSYPGVLSSTDDFLFTSEQLVVMETTNNIWNASLYDLVQPKGCVMSWVRENVATRLANNGSHWVSLFAQENSGTYNNMWIVVDYQLFTPFASLKQGTLTILEQLPGYTQTADMTHVLSYGFWPSFNRAYFEETRQLSGQLEMVKKFSNGAYFSYDGNPRARIMRRDANKISNTSDLQRFIRYNDFKNDPFAEGQPANQIAARYDLAVAPTKPSAGGAIDAKITSLAMVKNMTMLAQAGPTHDTQPVFVWQPPLSGETPHVGQPRAFNFDWEVFTDRDL